MKKNEFMHWLLSIENLNKEKLTHITEHFLKQKMFIELSEIHDFFAQAKLVKHLEKVFNKKPAYLEEFNKYVWDFNTFSLVFYTHLSEIIIRGNVVEFLVYVIELENFSLMVEDIVSYYSITENEKDITLY